MRIGFFLLLSLALHATALCYPVFFSAPGAPELLPVTLLDLGDAGNSDDAGKGAGEKSDSPPGPLKRRGLSEPQIRKHNVIKTEPKQDHAILTDLTAIPSASEGVAVTFNQKDSMASEADASGFAGLAESGGRATGGGDVAGFLGTAGSGKGNGGGCGVTTARRVGVTYAYSPKPDYPESARNEGREGTVVLRVLVDEEGRSKSLTVSRSSGFEALDKAALNTVRRWRFNAARDGDQHVESWVNIPIVFRLADAKD
jgi:TonB family protein